MVMALLFVFGLNFLSTEQTKLRSIEQDRFLMTERANELKQSSEDLTRFARLYVTTSNTTYKDQYFKVLSIRNGKSKSLLNYCSIYWDLPEPLRSERHPLGKPHSLKNKMEQLPYLEKEFENLRLSEKKSNELAEIEIKAFSLLEGLSSKHAKSDEDDFSEEQGKAMKLLTSENYQLAKQKIMLPIDDFLHSLSTRSAQTVDKQRNKVQYILTSLLAILSLSLIAMIAVIFFVRTRVIKPLEYLNRSIANGTDSDEKIDDSIMNSDEIGQMISRFFKMRNKSQDDFKRLEFALNAGKHGWFDFHLSENKVVVSSQYAKLIGLPAVQFSANLDEWRKGILPEDREIARKALDITIDNDSRGEVEFRRIKEDGEIICLHTIGEVVDWTDDGRPKRLIGMATDITEVKKRRDELSNLAHYDVLTKLPNRNLLEDRFLQAVAHCRRTDTQLAICFLDLDDFKPINDQFGHAAGDMLLVKVAKRLKEVLRDQDTVSRQGGDEFVLLLGDLKDYSECEQTLNRIRDSLSKPFEIEGRNHYISSSAGVTIYPRDLGEIDTLLRHADHAMYQAKLAGKNQFSLFNSEEDEQQIHKHGKLAQIEQALSDNQLFLHYQPKVNMKTGKIFGVEALIRWQHPVKGLIPPLEFLPIIEGNDLEIEVGNWVIEKALTQLQEWKDKNIELEVSVNIASHHLLSASFVSSVQALLYQYSDISPSSLQLEILESSALSDLNTISHVIKECRESLGVNVALDDFGTGYSSLTHLRNLSANTIKIDQTFVRDVLEDPGDYAIIDGVIGLANAFDRKIIAEGVETTEQGKILLLMNCENAQGYGIAKPMPASQIEQWLKEYKPNNSWLQFASDSRSKQQRELEILKLTTSQWRKHFMDSLSSQNIENIDWPIMDMEECLCGNWVRRAKQEGLFESNFLSSIDKIHIKIHKIGNRLKQEFLANKGRVKKSDVDELEDVFNELSEIANVFSE